MIEIYRPQFTHKDWIDNQDRVQAGGEEGLNRRFHQLEDEFAGLAKNQINPMLAVLGTATRHLTLVPALIAYTDAEVEVPAWAQAIDMVEKPAGEAAAHGFMNVLLPDGVLVRSLLMTGANQSSKGTLTVALKGRKIDNGDVAKTLVGTTRLDVAVEPEGEAEIENESHRYFLTVDVEGADLDARVQVFCVRIAYQ
ncbi:hypothetical protein [Streptomyces sp. NPDC002057]|uniref:hypothetical protein n=1 Tax=Streptomyces sp. NPDC002057 TaxID=3154664 RepID=UPI003325F94B